MHLSKKTIVIIGICVAVLIGLFIFKQLTKKEPKLQEVKTFVKQDKATIKQSTEQSKIAIDTTNQSEVNQKLGISTSESSSDDAAESTSESTTDVSNVELVKTTMQTYSAIDLNSKTLDSRNQKLKSQLSEQLYESLKIDSETTTLKKMLENWKSKKELDTNQSVQLLEQSIQSLKVYLNDTDSNDFVVVVTEQLKSPASPNTSIIVRQYSVTTSNNKVSAITKTSEVAGKK